MGVYSGQMDILSTHYTKLSSPSGFWSLCRSSYRRCARRTASPTALPGAGMFCPSRSRSSLTACGRARKARHQLMLVKVVPPEKELSKKEGRGHHGV